MTGKTSSLVKLECDALTIPANLVENVSNSVFCPTKPCHEERSLKIVYDDLSSISGPNDTPVMEVIDPGLLTGRICKAGLAIMVLVGLGAIVYGAVEQRVSDTTVSIRYDSSQPFNYYGNEDQGSFTPYYWQLFISFVVTGFSEIAGLVHSTSLRFTLLATGKLTFNSNLRLFASCKAGSRVHWWPVNIVWAWCLITSYVCGSMVLVQSANSGSEIRSVVCGYSLIFLGFGLLGQAAIAVWAIKTRRFLTWSTDPFHVAAVCHNQGWLSSTSHCTMMSVHDTKSPTARPRLPRSCQNSLVKADRRVLRVLIAIWIVAFLALAAFTALALTFHYQKSISLSDRSFTWKLLPTDWRSGSLRAMTPMLLLNSMSGYNKRFVFKWWFVFNYLITCLLIGGVTFSLNLVELIVSASRDENLWRKTGSAKGLKYNKHGAIYTALTNWQTMLLFVLKSFIHWMFGLAWGMQLELTYVAIPQVLYTAVSLLFLAAWATALAIHKPKGAQPATFGHFQTLSNLVDVWPCRMPSAEDESFGDLDRELKFVAQSLNHGVLYWGDKGHDADGFRRAGTSFSPLEPIVMNALYQ